MSSKLNSDTINQTCRRADIDRLKGANFHNLSRKEILDLFRLCAKGDPGAKEAVANLFLDTGDAGPVDYCLSLAAFLFSRGAHHFHLPDELVRLICELAASARGLPGDVPSKRFFEQVLQKISPKNLTWLLDRRFPVNPFLSCLPPKRIFSGNASAATAARGMWRRLRRRLYRENMPEIPAERSLEITLADLRPLLSALGTPLAMKSLNGLWRRLGIHLTARSGPSPNSVSSPPAPKQLYWGGSSRRKLDYWDMLTAMQARELSSIRNLAQEVSTRTRRVVLSWHNASLAAAGGWAFQGISAQFASEPLFEDFARLVQEESVRIEKELDFNTACRLLDMRTERLFKPKAFYVQEEARTFSRYSGKNSLASFSKGGLDEQERASVESTCEWPGAVAPHQQITLEQLHEWDRSSRQGWTEGLILLLALACAGQKMLDAGRISSLVLPWIDKFFISSRRRADIPYIERLFQFLSREVSQPLILFWEDTAHRQAPSFSLALGDLCGRGLPARGIGIFNPDLSADSAKGRERSEALEIICREFPRKQLFALRPLDDNHCPEAFRMIFRELDRHFFRAYDSSWKDNLVFIYTGTQVFPLLSLQTDMETVEPWISGPHVRAPFGTWFRRRLRHLSLGGEPVISEPLSMSCARWANLL